MAYSCSRVSGSDAVNSCSSSFFIHSWYLSHNTLHNYQWKYRYCNDVRSYLSMWDLSLFQTQVKSDRLFSVLKSFIRLRQNWTRKSWYMCVKCLRIIPHPCGYHPRHLMSKLRSKTSVVAKNLRIEGHESWGCDVKVYTTCINGGSDSYL